MKIVQIFWFLLSISDARSASFKLSRIIRIVVSFIAILIYSDLQKDDNCLIIASVYSYMPSVVDRILK